MGPRRRHRTTVLPVWYGRHRSACWLGAALAWWAGTRNKRWSGLPISYGSGLWPEMDTRLVHSEPRVVQPRIRLEVERRLAAHLHTVRVCRDVAGTGLRIGDGPGSAHRRRHGSTHHHPRRPYPHRLRHRPTRTAHSRSQCHHHDSRHRCHIRVRLQIHAMDDTSQPRRTTTGPGTWPGPRHP